jgi:glutamyl-tRNA(Gln) amidotransferase subunit E
MLAKEAVPEVLRGIARGDYSSVHDYLKSYSMSLDELDSLIDSTLERFRDKVLERGDRAFGMLMGEVMRVARGRIDGSIVSERLRIKLKEFLKT